MTIIPRPSHVEARPGTYQLNAGAVIVSDDQNRANAHYLRTLLAPSTGFALPIQDESQAAEPAIRLRLIPGLAALGPQGYQLDISPAGILVEGSAPAGVFYGLQSLRQLLPPEIERRTSVETVDWRLACLRITDQPRFDWRGFMLDEGRHFLGRQTVLQTLDLMALQKLNVFHWHLTEDEGWRIEIGKYPKLTGIGAQRAGTAYSFVGHQHNRLPHGGFYTQAEIRAVIAYAAERYITVVPEIEMPGHSLAALAAYPELSCTGGPFEVGTHFGIYKDIYCAGKETVFSFLEDVLEQVLELFPSHYIHIGGDEAPKDRWKNCPDCRSRMHAEGLKDTRALQVYFINRIAKWLETHGRQAIIWNDILEAGLDERVAIQFWVRGRKKLLQAIRNDQRPVVMSTYLDAYLDHAYNLMPLSRAYRYEPVPHELASQAAGSILGLEFPLWSEWVPDRLRLDYQTYPRLIAMAETGWTAREQKDFPDFWKRLPGFLERLDLLGIRYAPLDQAEPARIKQLFGLLSIARPQTRISGPNSDHRAIL